MAFNTARWTIANIVPVLFVVKIFVSLWYLYVFLHLASLLQSQDPRMHRRGIFQTIVSQTFSFLVLVCFARVIATDPGSVPKTAEWQSARKKAKSAQDILSEVKLTGEPRFCKWCNHHKPDRCHHCRVCRSCILRMDHHCPWIANCVGFGNHKYFLLLVLYGLLSCLFICATLRETVLVVLDAEVSSLHRLGVVYCMTLASVGCTLLGPFLCLHIIFMAKAHTTIEFCEKRSKKSGSISYDRGLLENARSVFGPKVLLWWLPVCPPEGDGVYWQGSPDKLEAVQATSAAAADEKAGTNAMAAVDAQGRSKGHLSPVSEAQQPLREQEIQS